jgi:hypothetical protein
MPLVFRWFALVLAVLATTVGGSGQQRTGIVGDLIDEVTQVETKIVGLAKAMPEAAYGWRPSDGVRTTAEVLIHVAADNYYAAAKWGATIDADTGITGASHKEAETYEQRQMSRGQIIAALERSFALLKKSMVATPDAALETMTDYARQKTTVRSAWIRTTTHLHEHLGQLIAYARSNTIVPPWSK